MLHITSRKIPRKDLKTKYFILMADRRTYKLHLNAGKDNNMGNGINMEVMKFHFQAWRTLS
ncbi:hypothetical protein V1477_004414 [Vespula maculifrons]|uniref:Uncharacterized protein n=1 Tax=Vespula maculifrons TaxID=7453 RepID=A0ABD2CRJ4_VESMC